MLFSYLIVPSFYCNTYLGSTIPTSFQHYLLHFNTTYFIYTLPTLTYYYLFELHIPAGFLEGLFAWCLYCFALSLFFLLDEAFDFVVGDFEDALDDVGGVGDDVFDVGFAYLVV